MDTGAERSLAAALSPQCAVTGKRVPGRSSSFSVHAALLCLGMNLMNNPGQYWLKVSVQR